MKVVSRGQIGFEPSEGLEIMNVFVRELKLEEEFKLKKEEK